MSQPETPDPLPALARETMKEIFDEDIVRSELEFDTASQNLVEHFILTALRQAQQVQQERVEALERLEPHDTHPIMWAPPDQSGQYVRFSDVLALLRRSK